MELAGKNAVVVGLARSGIAAAEFLLRRGARVVATDSKASGELGAEALRLAGRGALLETGGHVRGTFTGADLVVVSPGVPWDLPELVAARQAGVRVMAELELGFLHIQGPVAAVTGTKGKSTTTAALGAMLREAGQDVRVGGNIGEAVSGLIEGALPGTGFVLETSSFQLEGTETFRPKVAVFLNLSPDHLDRHPSFETYAEAKARIFRNQTEEDWAVVNGDDAAVLALAEKGRARRLAFRHQPTDGDGAFFASGEAHLRLGGQTETLFELEDVRLPGAHLALDLLAAATAARLLGAHPEAVSRAVRGFRGVEHVLEHVTHLRDVAFYNDSKATNVAAARRSLESFTGPVLLILGGRYKGGDFGELAPALARQGKGVFAIGEARPRIVEALSGVVPVVSCESLREAVERALSAAAPGDTVLLAPGCSSFDMFRDYADRGHSFKEEVRRLEEKHVRQTGTARRDGPPARSEGVSSAEPGSTPGGAEKDDDAGARTRNG